MSKPYFYIVVTIIDKKYFYSNKSDFTNTFSDVMKFDTCDEADRCINNNRLDEINAEIIECIE